MGNNPPTVFSPCSDAYLANYLACALPRAAACLERVDGEGGGGAERRLQSARCSRVAVGGGTGESSVPSSCSVRHGCRPPLSQTNFYPNFKCLENKPALSYGDPICGNGACCASDNGRLIKTWHVRPSDNSSVRQLVRPTNGCLIGHGMAPGARHAKGPFRPHANHEFRGAPGETGRSCGVQPSLRMAGQVLWRRVRIVIAATKIALPLTSAATARRASSSTRATNVPTTRSRAHAAASANSLPQPQIRRVRVAVSVVCRDRVPPNAEATFALAMRSLPFPPTWVVICRSVPWASVAAFVVAAPSHGRCAAPRRTVATSRSRAPVALGSARPMSSTTRGRNAPSAPRPAHSAAAASLAPATRWSECAAPLEATTCTPRSRHRGRAL